MSVRDTVQRTIAAVASEQGKTVPNLNDDLSLLDSGLDSLALAVIVARLEDELGVDPFQIESDAAFPLTIGEFVSLYEHASPMRNGASIS